jgi:prepilin-type processing-associated H-X9-DG protein
MDLPRHDNADLHGIDGDVSKMQAEHSSRDGSQTPLVRTSRIAIASAVCTIASPACFVFLLLTGSILDGPCLGVMLVLIFLILPGAALVLGLVGLASIGFSGGRRTGYAFAVAGISLPLAGLLFLLPMVLRVRVLSHRMDCGTNLSGIGKAMLIYASDNDGAFPRAGGRRGAWAARTPSWAAESREHAYGLSDPNAEDGRAGISASLYLLVKYTDFSANIFVCPSDKGTTAFQPAAYGTGTDMIHLWDFGPNPPLHCSYAYQMVHGPFGLTFHADPGLAILADRNPWMDSPSAKAGDFSQFQPDITPFNGTVEQAKRGNTVRHQRDGQNVLFLDGHIEFERRSYCGVDNDNIYTSWAGQDKVRGVPPKFGSTPADAKDSLLVNDPVHPAK